MTSPAADKKVRGTARVAFLAQLDTIVAELERGHTAQAVFERLQPKLGGRISYQQFARYVRHLREDGVVTPPLGHRPSRQADRVAADTAAFLAAKPTPSSDAVPQLRGPAHARHEHRPRTFEYDGTPRQDDKSRLIGEPRQSSKG